MKLLEHIESELNLNFIIKPDVHAFFGLSQNNGPHKAIIQYSVFRGINLQKTSHKQLL